TNRMAQVDAIELDLAAFALRPRSLRVLDFWCQRADHRGANRELDPRKVRLFGLPAGQHPLRIVGLDPALEKTRGHGQLDGLSFAAVELHAREPARVDVVADLGAKTILHARPAVQIHARHFLSRPDGTNRWERGRNAALRRETCERKLFGQQAGKGAAGEKSAPPRRMLSVAVG